jgi:hypothetical protein
MTRISLLCLSALMSVAVASQTGIEKAAAGENFDGSWTVSIMTDRGDCNAVQRLTVAIRDGALEYSGSSALELHGRVNNEGRVQVRVATNGQNANGTGHLTGTSGSGVWHGAGTTGTCTGRWMAERA